MRAIYGICGVFAVFVGILLLAYPWDGMYTIGWMVAILLLAWGFFNIIYYNYNREILERLKMPPAVAVLALIIGAVAVVVCIVAMLNPSLMKVFDEVIFILFAIWLVIGGIGSVIASVPLKKQGGKTWIWSLVLGIILIAVGIYGFFHLFLIAEALDIALGIFLIIYGVELIFSTADTEN